MTHKSFFQDCSLKHEAHEARDSVSPLSRASHNSLIAPAIQASSLLEILCICASIFKYMLFKSLNQSTYNILYTCI